MTGRRSVVLMGCAVVLPLVLLACEVRPSTVERWANRPGSEERFIGYLQDPSTSLEVKQKSLEMLVRQWQYSASMLRDGEPLRAMPQADVRDRILVDLLPFLRERAQASGVQRYHQRDIAYHLMRGSESAEVREAYVGFLTEWMSSYWEPCVSGGTVSPRAVLERIGPERGAPLIVERLQSMSFADIGDCLRPQLRGLPWLPTHDGVAQGWIQRWEVGDRPTGDDIMSQQAITNFFEGMDLSGPSDAMKRWLLETLATPGAPFGHFFDQMLKRHREESDAPLYVEAVGREGEFRFQAMVVLAELRGAEGVRMALSALPEESAYNRWGQQEREDGLQLGAHLFCTDDAVKALRESGRLVFEAVMADGEATTPARAVAAYCLGQLDNQSALPALRAVQSDLGRTSPAVPHWGGANLGTVVGRAVATLSGN